MRRISDTVLGLMILAFAVFSNVSLAAVGDTLQNNIALKIEHSGKYLDISNSNKSNGAKVQQWSGNGTNAQKFRFNDVGDGWFEIQNVNSNKCLDARDWKTHPGVHIQQWDCSGPKGHNQHFKWDGKRLRIRHNQALCLDVADWSKADGGQIQAWTCGNQPNQYFAIEGGNGGGSTGGGDENNGQGNNGRYVNIKVRNFCPMPLWIHVNSAQGTLQPDNQKLEAGQSRDYQSPNHAISGRVEARRHSDLRKDADEKAEYTFIGNPVILNYNATYVDFYGLPVSVSSSGKGSDCKRTGSNVPLKDFFTGCPSALWNAGEQRCYSPRTFCLKPENQGHEYCKRLDGVIDECVNRFADCKHAAGAKTPEAYACSGRFSEDPKNCAAINRGMLDDRESADKNKYYKKWPYNEYAKWSHEKNPNMYSFPYDDYPMNAETSGFHACADGSELVVTFCPAG